MAWHQHYQGLTLRGCVLPCRGPSDTCRRLSLQSAASNRVTTQRSIQAGHSLEGATAFFTRSTPKQAGLFESDYAFRSIAMVRFQAALELRNHQLAPLRTRQERPGTYRLPSQLSSAICVGAASYIATHASLVMLIQTIPLDMRPPSAHHYMLCNNSRGTCG
jgi:hypothetical protein